MKISARELLRLYSELIGKTEHHFEIAQYVVQYLDTSPNIEKSIRIEITVPPLYLLAPKKAIAKRSSMRIQQRLPPTSVASRQQKRLGGWYDGDGQLAEEPSRKISTDLPIGYRVHSH